MTDKYFIGNTIEIDRRKIAMEEFCNTILDPEEIPFIITDDASLFDIYIGSEDELIQKVKEKYSVTIQLNDFKIPLWKLLDFLKQA